MDSTIAHFSRKGTWRTYTIADGLPDLRTEHLAEDREGFLWIGTWDGGACRFDGEEFRTFTARDGLSGNRVMAIHLDRQGRLWFGTWEGNVCFWDGKAFHRFDGQEGVSGKPIQFIFEDGEGRLWFAGSEALGYCEATTFHDLVPTYCRQYGEPPSGPPPDQCFGIAQDRDGHLWFAFARGNLVRYDGERFYRYGEEHGLPAGRRTVAQNGEGDLWVGAGGNLYRCDGQTFHPVPVESKVQIDRMRKIQCDRQGRTWLCTGNGVFCHDGAQFHPFTYQDGLAYDIVNAMLQDREGNIWFATWGGGLSCYDPTSLQVLSEREGLPYNTVFHLAEDHQEHLWMGFTPPGNWFGTEHSKTLSRYDGECLTALGEKEGLDHFAPLYVDARNRLWTAGFGLQQYDGRAFQKIDMGAGFENIVVSALCEDREGRLLLGHWQDGSTLSKRDESPLQLTRYDGNTFQTLLTREKADPSTYIRALAATRRGEIYFGLGTTFEVGPGEGMGRWREGEKVRYYTTQDGLIDNRVTELLEDRHGRLWIATYGGLSRFDGRTFLNFTIEDGLPSNHIYALCEDRQGHLWIGTDAGLVRYNGKSFQIIHASEIGSVFDLLQDRQGKMWFATTKGAVHYTPGTVPPKVRVQQVLADRTYGPDEEIHFSTSTRQVVFEYKGMSFRTHPRNMLYACKLEGHDRDWQQPTRQARALYRDLPPGEYIFQVKSIDRDLNESEPASVKLTVIRDERDQIIDELERRVQERTRELEERNQALEEAYQRIRAQNAQIQLATRRKSEFLSRMSHDLRTPMNAIIGYTRILLRKVKTQLDERQYQNLENIQLSATHLLALINDILDLSRIEAGRIDLHPEKVDIRQVVTQCTATFQPLLQPGVELRQEVADGLSLHTDADRLRRILMNLLGNAVKFTEAGSITVSAWPGEGHVQLAVSDTGSGIPAEELPYIFEEFRQVAAQKKEGSGLGLAIVKKSVEVLGGSIAVESQVGRGTTFTLRLANLEAVPKSA
jgi:signal transduction histidine kinase/ligand-binding sensor domain-containing protein